MLLALGRYKCLVSIDWADWLLEELQPCLAMAPPYPSPPVTSTPHAAQAALTQRVPPVSQLLHLLCGLSLALPSHAGGGRCDLAFLFQVLALLFCGASLSVFHHNHCTTVRGLPVAVVWRLIVRE